jgi:hypothetical protein
LPGALPTPLREQGLHQRRRVSAQHVTWLHGWLTRTSGREPPASGLGKACAYWLNHWDALTRFLDDGRLPIDNTEVERQIRALAVGRKNYFMLRPAHLLPPKRLSTPRSGPGDLSPDLGSATRRSDAYRGGTHTRWFDAARRPQADKGQVELEVVVRTHHTKKVIGRRADGRAFVPKTPELAGGEDADTAGIGIVWEWRESAGVMVRIYPCCAQFRQRR